MKEKFPSELQEKFTVRFPDGMRDKIAEIARLNNRSMNAEIIHILDKSLSGGDKQYYKKEALDLVQKALDKYEELMLTHSDNKHK